MHNVENHSYGDEPNGRSRDAVRHYFFAAFSHSCGIGFAILDNHLRYEAINHCLTAIHGIPAREHLGHTVREVLGEVGADAAPRYQRVLANGEHLCFEITNALLPRRIQNAYSALKSCFPLRDGAGNINKVGITVIDVTGQRRLEKFLSELGGNLRDVDTRENFSLARELHNSIEEYHSALALSLDVVFRNHKKSTELAQSIRQLDQRITAMNTFVSSIASRFGIDK